MADASALAGLLDRAYKAFGLASSLGWEFQQEFRERPAVNIIWGAEETPQQRHRERINEFITALFDLRHEIQNPPDGFAAVAEHLRKAGRIAKRIRESHPGDVYAGDILELFPDLNQVGHDGRQAVKELEKAERLDDPWAFVEDPPAPAAIEPAPGDATAGGDFIERLLGGPNDVELTPRELALVEAHLKQPISLAKMQREAQAGTRETATARNKLKLIRDFNRNLQAATTNRTPDPVGSFSAQGLAATFGGSSNGSWGNAPQGAPYAPPTNPLAPAETTTPTETLPAVAQPTERKRRGRRKADYETVQRESQLAADWEQARNSGVYKPDFAKEHGTTAAKLDALLDRVAKRNQRSDK